MFKFLLHKIPHSLHPNHPWTPSKVNQGNWSIIKWFCDLCQIIYLCKYLFLHA